MYPDRGGATEATFVIAATMVALALTAAYAALKARPLVVLFTFVASFFPVGFYLLLTPNGLWIGVGNLLYLLAGALIATSRVAKLRASGSHF